jgi:hypothetical protein
VGIPAGAGATTVQIFSEPIGQNPDSLLWVMAALRVPLPVPTACAPDVWVTQTETVWFSEAGVRSTEKVKDVFKEASRFGAVGAATLRTALRFRGGAGLLGAAKDLVQAGTAALLNAGHPRIEYPLTKTQVVTRVDTALRSEDTGLILATARDLATLNGAVCPLR